MKYFFSITFLILVALSVVAWAIKPQLAAEGKIPLIWVESDAAIRHEQVDLFNELYPQYDLRLDPGSAGMEKIIVQCLGGVGPDLFCANDNFHLTAFVRSGIALDLTDELKKMGIDVEDETWQAAHHTSIYRGSGEPRVYGFPANVATQAVWYNKDIFDEAGLEYPQAPWKWEEFIEVAQKLTVRDEKGRPIRYGFMFDPQAEWVEFVLQWGGNVYSEDGTRCTLDTPEAIAGVQFMYDLIYKHRVSPTPAELSTIPAQGGGFAAGGANPVSLFANGKAAMAYGGRWWLVIFRGFEELKISAVEGPYHTKPIYRGYGKSVLINKNSPRIQEALDFIKFLYSEPYNEMINDQADGVAPVKKYAYTEDFLFNPDYPEEDYNEIWRNSLENCVPSPSSPFVNGSTVVRLITKQIDLITNDLKSVDEAMKDVTEQINEEIQRTIEMDPQLRKLYEQRTGEKTS